MSEVEIISKEYFQLQKDLAEMQKQWSQKIEANLKNKDYNRNAPLVTEVEFEGDLEDYKKILYEIIDYLQEKQPQIREQLTVIREKLVDNIQQEWLQESLMMNDFYFSKWAKDHLVEEWLPIFLAENASRVYIRSAVGQLKDELPQSKVKGCCPGCGEPPRLAVVGKKGGKELVCPRCHYTWNEKKHTCSYCGNEEHEHMVVLKAEGNNREEILACNECNNYTKVIDTRAMIKKPAPEIIDLQTIHLDYIAQDEGYGTEEEKART